MFHPLRAGHSYQSASIRVYPSDQRVSFHSRRKRKFEPAKKEYELRTQQDTSLQRVEKISQQIVKKSLSDLSGLPSDLEPESDNSREAFPGTKKRKLQGKVDIFWRNWDKFKKFAACLENLPEFAGRMNRLKGYFSNHPIRSGIVFDHYFTLDKEQELYIKIKIKEKHFKSSAFKADPFDQITKNEEEEEAAAEASEEETSKPAQSSEKKFDYIIVCESIVDQGEDADFKVLKIRLSKTEPRAELDTIRKGVRLSGNEVFELYTVIIKAIRVKEAILYDDSKFPIEDPRPLKRKVPPFELPLRKLCALSHTADTGYSWYEEKGGFVPLNCKKMKTHWDTVAQSDASYRKDIHLIRNTTLGELKQIYKGYTRTISVINRLKNQYLKGSDAATVHELVIKAQCIAKSKKVPAKAFAASKDLRDLFAFVINFWKLEARNNQAREFLNALENIEGTRIYFKEYA